MCILSLWLFLRYITPGTLLVFCSDRQLSDLYRISSILRFVKRLSNTKGCNIGENSGQTKEGYELDVRSSLESVSSMLGKGAQFTSKNGWDSGSRMCPDRTHFWFLHILEARIFTCKKDVCTTECTKGYVSQDYRSAFVVRKKFRCQIAILFKWL